MTRHQPVSDDDLQAIIRSEIAAADGQSRSELSIERIESHPFFPGTPSGNFRKWVPYGSDHDQVLPGNQK